MHLLGEVMEHATFTIIVIVGTVVLVGLPKARSRYRILSLILMALCVAAAFQWSAYYFFQAYYHPESPRWPYAGIAVLFGALALTILVESIALRFYESHGKDKTKA